MQPHEGYGDAVKLTVSLCLIYTLCIAGVRVWIRKGQFGSDDLVIAAATIITLCKATTSYVSLAAGLGLPWSSIERLGKTAQLNEASIAGVVTFVIGLYMSKCAMLSFLSRITKTPSQILLFNTCNGITAATGVISVLVATVGCPSGSGYYWAFYDNHVSCPSQSARWQAVTALDICTEVLLLALPVYLVWGLQMSMRKKAMILIAFYLRLPVIGFSIGRNYYTMLMRLPKTDPGLGSGLVVIWLDVELAYALAASTLSALRAFTESFNSCFGLGFTRGKGDGSYGMSDVSGGSGKSSKAERNKDTSGLDSAASQSRIGSVDADPLKGGPEISVSPMTSTAEIIEEVPLRLRPEPQSNTITSISSEPTSVEQHAPWREDSSASSHNSGAEDMGIVRETTFDIHHDRAPMLPLDGGA